MATTQSHSGGATVGAAEVSLTSGTTTLGSIAEAGVYQALIDFSALAAGDAFAVTLREKVRATDPQRVVFSATVAGPQAEPVWASAALALVHGWEFSVRKIAGADRALAWSIRKAA